MQHVENIIIAAAGRGKRLGLGLPKCLVRVQNRAIIEYQLHLVRHIPHVRLVVGILSRTWWSLCAVCAGCPVRAQPQLPPYLHLAEPDLGSPWPGRKLPVHGRRYDY